MRTIKRLDLFLLKTFLPLFIMTFGICLFIFLMQFLWKYVDEMVGKGIEMYIIAKLFFYVALTHVPNALPLAILFASLMTFGNLGEQLELLAMKASGISLVRIMMPLTLFLVIVAISAFFFQNNVIPVSQVKMYTLLVSVKQKSPELEIPESTFYPGLSGKNIYVRKKDKKTKMLRNVMIYDSSEGFNNMRVIVADSGQIKTSVDKKYLILSLFSGESFENYKENKNRARDAKDAVPYRRESFDMMEMLIEFDGNFSMTSESMFQDRYVGKNLASLQQSIDSMTVRLDSIKSVESKALFSQSYRRTLAHTAHVEPVAGTGKIVDGSFVVGKDSLTANKPVINFDSLYSIQKPDVKMSLLSYSKRNIDNLLMNYGFKSSTLSFEEKEIRWHHTEMHRKFTLSFACLIFFFIGAPLGAIIRKGGLGAPAVISVFLFIVYYIIDNIGYKMARDGIWLPWQGMWMSSTVLLPLGVFLTNKAVNDSVILNAETYIDAIKRFVGKREFRKIEKKDIIMELPDYDAVTVSLQNLNRCCKQYIAANSRRMHYINFWKQGGTDGEAEQIALEIESVVSILENSDQNLVLNKTMDFPIINTYHPASFKISPRLGMILAVCFPVGGIIYLIALYRRKLLRQDIKTAIRVCDELIEIINGKNMKK
ncbi:MAG: LptF/LptG family permease [Tannerella sp.]|jgi:lipopolysaccharide export system permease protein|nr:LptF/LptG family permease [Tannerella sp.]